MFPWNDLGDFGYSTQACNVNSNLGEFSELEYHIPGPSEQEPDVVVVMMKLRFGLSEAASPMSSGLHKHYLELNSNRCSCLVNCLPPSIFTWRKTFTYKSFTVNYRCNR